MSDLKERVFGAIDMHIDIGESTVKHLRSSALAVSGINDRLKDDMLLLASFFENNSATLKDCLKVQISDIFDEEKEIK